jgi:hypothetical protein
MSKWEYAYIEFTFKSVEIWFVTPSGNTVRTEPIQRKEKLEFEARRQIAKLCSEGWEIFQITRRGDASVIFPTVGDVFHFKRQS